MDDEFDIYGGLNEFDLQTQKNEVEHENIELKQRLKELECKTTHMGTEKDRIVKEHKASLKNFSSLLETAKIELDRKDRQIKEGRKKYDDLCFRRTNALKPKIKMENKSIQTDFNIDTYSRQEETKFSITDSNLEDSQRNRITTRSEQRHEYREHEQHYSSRDKTKANNQLDANKHSLFNKNNDINEKSISNGNLERLVDSNHRRRAPDREKRHSMSAGHNEMNEKPTNNGAEEKIKHGHHRHRAPDQERKHSTTSKHSGSKSTQERIEDNHHRHRPHQRERRHPSSVRNSDIKEKPLFRDAEGKKEDGHYHHRTLDHHSLKKEKRHKDKQEKRSRSKTRSNHSDHEKELGSSQEQDRLRQIDERGHLKEGDHMHRNVDDSRNNSKRKRNAETDEVFSRHHSSKKSCLDSNENISSALPKDFAETVETKRQTKLENIDKKQSVAEVPVTPPTTESPSDAEEGEIITPAKHVSIEKVPPKSVVSAAPPLNELGSTGMLDVGTKISGHENTTCGSNDSLWDVAIAANVEIAAQDVLEQQCTKIDSIEPSSEDVSLPMKESTSLNPRSGKRKCSSKQHDTPKKRGSLKIKSENRDLSEQVKKQFEVQDVMYANLYDDLEIAFVTNQKEPYIASTHGTKPELDKNKTIVESPANLNPVQMKLEDQEEVAVATSAVMPTENLCSQQKSDPQLLSTPCISTVELSVDETSSNNIPIASLSTSDSDKSNILNVSLGNNEYRIDTLNGEATFITIMTKKRKKKKNKD